VFHGDEPDQQYGRGDGQATIGGEDHGYTVPPVLVISTKQVAEPTTSAVPNATAATARAKAPIGS
jgi:hypothetical protein